MNVQKHSKINIHFFPEEKIHVGDVYVLRISSYKNKPWEKFNKGKTYRDKEYGQVKIIYPILNVKSQLIFKFFIPRKLNDLRYLAAMIGCNIAHIKSDPTFEVKTMWKQKEIMPWRGGCNDSHNAISRLVTLHKTLFIIAFGKHN